MKILAALFCALLSGVSLAATKVDLSQVTPATAIQLYYNEISRVDYVIEPSIFEDKRIVSFRSTNTNKTAFSKLLLSLGYAIRTEGGTEFIEKKDIQKESRIFKPKHRPANYFIKQTQGILGDVSFANQRPIAQPSNALSTHQAVEGSATALISQPADVIVMLGTKEALDQAEMIFRKLDTAPESRVLKVTILEFRKDTNSDDAISAISEVATKTGLVVDTANGVFGVGTGSFTALLRSIASDSRFRSLSNPTLTITSGEVTKFVVGDSVPTLNGSTTSDTGQITQQIEYVDSGVVLSVSPIVSGLTTQLRISQQLSSFVPTLTGIATTPTLQKREVETVVNMKDGEALALAGLRSSGDSVVRRSFFGIPLGAGKSKQESEIMLIFQLDGV